MNNQIQQMLKDWETNPAISLTHRIQQLLHSYGNQRYNEALDKAAEKATVTKKISRIISGSVENSEEFTIKTQGVVTTYSVNKQSILNLKLKEDGTRIY